MRAGLPSGDGVSVWTTASWRELVVSWLDTQLAHAGIKRTGDVQQPHVRPWGTVLTSPTTHGQIWLKAAAAATAFEISLYEPLNRFAPERVLMPIAADAVRGWIVLPDGGPPLADRVSGSELVDALVAILPRYGQLQRDLASEADNLVALGVSDMRAAMMPTRFDDAVAAAARHADPGADRAGHAALRQVVALSGDFGEWCQRLAAMPGAASIDHNDLHPWNMLVTNVARPHDVRFYDWGDAVVAHPFASMLVPLGWAQRELGVRLNAPEILRVRDAYLEAFSDLGSPTELVEALELACRVGKVARALTWARALNATEPDDLDAEHASAPLRSLRSLLDDSYLGGA